MRSRAHRLRHTVTGVRRTQAVNRRARLLAFGGVIGPVVFVATWALAGSVRSGYSPVDDAISDLAAVGTSTRVAMTIAFVVYGLGMAAFALALRDTLDGAAWVAALITGLATIGVAMTPLGGWSGDGAHAAFAGVGYVSIVTLPLLAAGPFAARGARRAAVASRVVALVAAGCLLASTLGPAHGLWQRLGLTVADAWIVAVATMLACSSRPGVVRIRTTP